MYFFSECYDSTALFEKCSSESRPLPYLPAQLRLKLTGSFIRIFSKFCRSTRLELPLLEDSNIPYGLTEWLWGTTVAHRFVEFSFRKCLALVKKEKHFFCAEKKQLPTEDDLDELWLDFIKNGLAEELVLKKPVQILHSVWTCLRAHAQFLCFMLVFALYGLVYKNLYMLFLPLSVLYASWKFPRPPTIYWNLLLVFTFIMILVKTRILSYFIIEAMPNAFISHIVTSDFASGIPIIEAMLFLSILWHRSILRPLGLWDESSEEIKPEQVATVDVYVPIALLEVMSIIIVCSSFHYFGAEHGDGGVIQYVEKDNVPLAFLIVLLLHLLSMALDRILYVSAAFQWRGLFHTVVWITLHVWLFVYVPYVTEKPFGFNSMQQVYYMIQCTYLLLSAYQVRNKHSRCSAVSVLCQNFSRINYGLFMIYCKMPFVEPIRRTIDCLFTKTKLTREEFVMIESIFENVFIVKCERVNEFKYLVNRQAQPIQNAKGKAFLGLIGVLAFLAFLASPVIYFILEEKATSSNPIQYMKIELNSPTLGRYYTQQVNNFDSLDEVDWIKIRQIYNSSRRAKTFLSDFSYTDVVVAHFPLVSITPWATSYTRDEIAEMLLNATELVTVFRWEATRKYSADRDYGTVMGNIKATAEYKDKYKAEDGSNLRKDPLARLADMIRFQNQEFAEPVVITDVLPKYIIFSKNDFSRVIPQLEAVRGNDGVFDIVLQLLEINDTKEHFTWKISQECTGTEYTSHVARLPKDQKCSTLDMYLFSDHPPLLPLVKGLGGLFGLYAGVIFAIYKLFAAFWSRDLHEIVYEEMVSVDRLLQLCLDIYLSRIAGEIDLELELGLKLINIFCSPTELDNWTHGETGVDARAHASHN